MTFSEAKTKTADLLERARGQYSRGQSVGEVLERHLALAYLDGMAAQRAEDEQAAALRDAMRT